MTKYLHRNRTMRNTAANLAAALIALGISAASFAAPALEQIAEFSVPEANQGVGVDSRHFYAVDNYVIGKYDKKTGKLVKKWEGEKKAPILHLDSAVLMGGKLYAAHSNYPQWPMTSSLEIFDAETMEHIGTHSFGIQWGSLTWADWHDGHWWMTFANYDRLLGPGKTPYGHKANTVMVKLTRDLRPVQSWTLPKVILDRFEDMSNSGGSWGPDGYLYLTGHDPAELYRMRLPKAGSVLELVDIIPMNIRGQGIAWDRSQPGVIYGVIRATAKERAEGGYHKVTVFRLSEKP
ncbi:MAG: cycloisomerase [Pseudomonadota bacterium]